MKWRCFWLRIACLGCILLCTNTFAKTIMHAKSWTTAVWIGTVSGTTHVKYYFHLQLRLIDNAYKFQTLFGFVGIGYVVRPTFVFHCHPKLLFL